MKKVRFLLMTSLMVLAAGCSDGSNSAESSSEDLLAGDWQETEEAANGQTVNMYMWGGNENINRYIDEWMAPILEKQHNIELNRVPVNDAQDVINQLLDEKVAGKTDGSVDIVWINGENFKAAKDNDLLWADFAGTLPNYSDFVDAEAPEIAEDFGEPVEGLEAPWGKAQFVFVYDEEKVVDPPKSMDELAKWVQENPGKFTYPALPDFTGSAFARHVLYETAGGAETYMKSAPELADAQSDFIPMWDYLNDIEPFLWRNGETYPESLAKLDQLYSSGEVWMTMGYDPVRPSGEVMNGRYPASTKTFVLDEGTLANTHFLSIPFNSTHQAGAMVAINEFLSPEAQIAKLSPENWGDLSALDLDKLSEAQQEAMNSVDLGEATLPLKELEDRQLPELSSDWVELIEKGWLENVAKN